MVLRDCGLIRPLKPIDRPMTTLDERIAVVVEREQMYRRAADLGHEMADLLADTYAGIARRLIAEREELENA